MKKKIFALALAAVMLVSGAMTAMAAETLTSAEWWTGTAGSDYTLSGDGTVSLEIEVTALNADNYGAFSVEIYDGNGKFLTTGSDVNAWYAGATGDAITGIADPLASTIGLGTYKVDVVRAGANFTVTYYNPDGSVYANLVANNTDMPTDVKIHVIPQVGTFVVDEAAEDAPANPDVPAKGDMSTVMTYVVLLAGAALVVVAAKKRFA